MPPDFDSVTGIAATTPSTSVQTGSSKSGTGRYPVLRQSIAAIQAAVDQIRENLANADRRLEFQADPVTGLVAVSIKDVRTGELIRQVPGNAILRLAEALAAADMGPQALVDLTA